MQPAVEKQYRMKDSVPRNVRARVCIIKRAPNADRKKERICDLHKIALDNCIFFAYNIKCGNTNLFRTRSVT